jgi:hypothetical protein
VNQFDYQRSLFASELEPNARLIGCVIGSHFNWSTKEYSFPSNKTIAQETGLSISSILRAKKQLVSHGYLSSDRRFNTSNLYQPMVPLTIPMVTQTPPMVTETIPYGQVDQLIDTLKDTLTDNLITKFESEDSNSNSIIISIQEESNSIPLDENEMDDLEYVEERSSLPAELSGRELAEWLQIQRYGSLTL